MRSPRTSREPSNLSDLCLARLNGYALAAGAAGVGLLAAAQPAGAEVVYTPVHHAITRHSSFALDLNHDGKNDFFINQTSGCSSEGFCQNRLYAYIPFYKDRGNGVVGQNAFPFHAYALRAGAQIGPAQAFNTAAASLYFNSRTVRSAGRCSGSWVDTSNRYLGLKFLIKGEVHFGWAEVSAKCTLGTRVVGFVEGYAYETEVNKPIMAGSTGTAPGAPGAGLGSARPATLATLALGAQGLALWRKELAGVAE